MVRASGMAEIIERPVWRRFARDDIERAAEHVRCGGHAVMPLDERRADLLLTVGPDGAITELGLWALLAIEHARWRRVRSGPARGLAAARVTGDAVASALDFCDRDVAHRRPTRTLELDCVACGACCHDADVLLDEADLARWRDAGRRDLLGRAYVRRIDGRVLLRFAPTGRCPHLGADRRCTIYELRPSNCRAFVVGSEACLAAREETLGLRDGRPAG